MTHASRRTFLAATGTGAAAAAAVVAAAPAALASPGQPSDDTVAGLPDLVAYIQDAATGTLTILVGEDEVVVHDPALVRSLTQAARR